MKKILIPIIALLGFSACQDCKGLYSKHGCNCFSRNFQSKSLLHQHLILKQEFFAAPTSRNYRFTNSQFLPVAYGEFCGSELKEYDGKSITSTITIGDSATTLYTYTWTERYDCK